MQPKFKLKSLVVAMGMALVSAPIYAAEEDDAAEDEVVVIVGSRAAPRSVGDSPVPVDVISGDELLCS